MKTKINDRFSIERDRGGWTLEALFDVSCGDCDSTTSIIHNIESARDDVLRALGGMNIVTGEVE